MLTSPRREPAKPIVKTPRFAITKGADGGLDFEPFYPSLGYRRADVATQTLRMLHEAGLLNLDLTQEDEDE